jgi:hypothetical protein
LVPLRLPPPPVALSDTSSVCVDQLMT